MIYLQNVLELHPEIKGPGRRLCRLIQETHSDGKPAVLIPIGVALTPPSQRRERETAAAPVTEPVEE